MNIEDRVIRSIRVQLGMPEGEITIDSDKESLGMDSFDDVECIMALEEEFDLEISDSDAERLESVRKVIDYISIAITSRPWLDNRNN